MRYGQARQVLQTRRATGTPRQTSPRGAIGQISTAGSRAGRGADGRDGGPGRGMPTVLAVLGGAGSEADTAAQVRRMGGLDGAIPQGREATGCAQSVVCSIPTCLSDGEGRDGVISAEFLARCI